MNRKQIQVILALLFVPWILSVGQMQYVQYWVDDDFRNGVTTLSYTAEQPAVVQLDEIDNVDKLPEGLHTLHVRAKDAQQGWSVVHSQSFVKQAVYNEANEITGYEYWIDGDADKRHSVAVSGQSVGINGFDLTDVPVGFHTLHMRAKDAQGNGSPLHSQSFYVGDVSASTANAIDRYHYWYDGDFASRQEVTLPEAVNPYELREKYVPPAAFAEGERHTFHIQFRDVAGRWSAVATDTFTVVPLFSEAEFEVLKVFYAATGGDEWHSTQRGDSVWTLDRMETVNDWKGLSFSGGHVNCIRLTANNLSGTIPAALADGLSHLTALRVDSNRIEGVEAALPAVWALDLRAQQFDFGEKYVEPGEDWQIPVYNVSRYDHASGVLTENNRFELYVNGERKTRLTPTNGVLTVRASYLEGLAEGDEVALVQYEGDAKGTIYRYTAAYRAIGTGLDNDAVAGVRLYPNPVTDGFRVDGVTDGARLMLLEATGRVVWSQPVRPGEYVPVTGLPAGVYTAVLHQGEIQTARKVVKL